MNLRRHFDNLTEALEHLWRGYIFLLTLALLGGIVLYSFPGSAPFFVGALVLGALVAFVLRLRHR